MGVVWRVPIVSTETTDWSALPLVVEPGVMVVRMLLDSTELGVLDQVVVGVG
jgi:hypothetical protein